MRVELLERQSYRDAAFLVVIDPEQARPPVFPRIFSQLPSGVKAVAAMSEEGEIRRYLDLSESLKPAWRR